MPAVADIIHIMDQIAPRRLAEEWDNVGLHYGDPDWTASTVFVSLDPTIKAIEAAASAGAGMLVTHHPLIFKPVKHIHTKSPVGAAIDLAARKRIAVFCAHTNLDAAAGGINDVLAEKIGLNVSGPLTAASGIRRYKLVVFAPPDDAERILESISGTSAGRIDNYRGCSFQSRGIGRFIPGRGSNPYAGSPDQPAQVDEIRIEIPLYQNDIDDVVKQIKANHRYETVAYDIYPLYTEKSGTGIGRIGEFSKERSLLQVAEDIKEALSLKTVKIAGPPELPVKTAAVCSGGGSSMVGDFLASSTDVYVSGDLNHHVALDISAHNRGLIDIGHFTSEQVIVPVLSRRIQEEANRKSIDVKVIPWRDEPDPFVYM